jgi:hypothetical protein
MPGTYIAELCKRYAYRLFKLVRGELAPDQTLPKLDDPILEPLHILHGVDIPRPRHRTRRSAEGCLHPGGRAAGSGAPVGRKRASAGCPERTVGLVVTPWRPRIRCS